MVLLPIGFALEGWIADALGVNGALWLGACWLVLTIGLVLSMPSVRHLPNVRVDGSGRPIDSPGTEDLSEAEMLGAHGLPLVGVEGRGGARNH